MTAGIDRETAEARDGRAAPAGQGAAEMTGRRLGARWTLIGAVLTAAAAALAVVLGLAVAEIRPAPAMLVAIAVAIVLAVVVVFMMRTLLAEIRAITQYGAGLAENAPVERPPVLFRVTAALLGAMSEIESARRAERAAVETDLDHANRTIERLPDPVLIVDRDRRVRRANAAAVALLSGGSGRITGRDIAAILRQPYVLDAVETALEGEPAEVAEFELPGNVTRTFAAHTVPLSEHGPAQTVVLMLTDLTERKRIDQLRMDFIANVSHELRTPLASMGGFVETLQGPARDDAPARERFLRIMAGEVGRMTRIVDDLLSLSRVELDEHRPPRDRVEVVPLLAAVCDVLAPQSAERNMRVRIEAAEAELAALGDRDQLSQLFRNLVENAVKYGGGGSDVEIRVAAHPANGEAGRRIEVAVKDYGRGIEAHHIPRLTERFYRVDTARSRSLGGTGLGLAIVKHIVNRHAGELVIESEPGKGSTFRVLLPAAPGPTSPA